MNQKYLDELSVKLAACETRNAVTRLSKACMGIGLDDETITSALHMCQVRRKEIPTREINRKETATESGDDTSESEADEHNADVRKMNDDGKPNEEEPEMKPIKTEAPTNGAAWHAETTEHKPTFTSKPGNRELSTSIHLAAVRAMINEVFAPSFIISDNGIYTLREALNELLPEDKFPTPDDMELSYE